MISKTNLHNELNKNLSPQDYLSNIQQFLNEENEKELLNYIKEIHNADLAEIIQKSYFYYHHYKN